MEALVEFTPVKNSQVPIEYETGELHGPSGHRSEQKEKVRSLHEIETQPHYL
jgi:hypothetical protein